MEVIVSVNSIRRNDIDIIIISSSSSSSSIVVLVMFVSVDLKKVIAIFAFALLIDDGSFSVYAEACSVVVVIVFAAEQLMRFIGLESIYT